MNETHPRFLQSISLFSSALLSTLLALPGCGSSADVDDEINSLLAADFVATCRTACELEEQGGCGIGIAPCYEACESLTQTLVAEQEQMCLEHGFLASGCSVDDVCREPACSTAAWLHTYASCTVRR